MPPACSSRSFAIVRIGVKAGVIHHDPGAKDSMYYFVTGDTASGAAVEAVMRGLDLKGAAAKATATRSLAKSEIVSLYRAATEKQTRRRGRRSS